MIEITIGFESNLANNVNRKQSKYKELVRDQRKIFRTAELMNFSISALGIFDKDCHTFLEMLNDLELDKKHQNYITSETLSPLP